MVPRAGFFMVGEERGILPGTVVYACLDVRLVLGVSKDAVRYVMPRIIFVVFYLALCK